MLNFGAYRRLAARERSWNASASYDQLRLPAKWEFRLVFCAFPPKSKVLGFLVRKLKEIVHFSAFSKRFPYMYVLPFI